MNRPENDINLAKYLRKVQRKAGQIDRTIREKRLNAVVDLLIEMDEEIWKAQTRISGIRFRTLPAICLPPQPEDDE